MNPCDTDMCSHGGLGLQNLVPTSCPCQALSHFSPLTTPPLGGDACGLQDDMGDIRQVCPLPGALWALPRAAAGGKAHNVMVWEAGPGSGSEASLQAIREAGEGHAFSDMQYRCFVMKCWICF